MKDLPTYLGSAGALIIAAFVLIVAILAFLMPIYVVMINGKLRRLNEQIESLSKSVIAVSPARATQDSLAQIKISNELSRQLLESYGITPRA